MPIPEPHEGESEGDFVSRCMGDKIMLKDYPDQKQRAAVCYSQARKRDTKSRADMQINATVEFDLEGGK